LRSGGPFPASKAAFGLALVGVLGLSTGAASAATTPKKAKRSPAATQAPPPVPVQQPPIGTPAYSWLLTVNATILYAPDFPGAKTYGFVAFPSLSFRRSDEGEKFQAPDDGVSIALYGDSRWTVGVTGRYTAGRYRTYDPARLYGIKDAKWAIEPGLFAEYWAVPDTLRMRGEIRYGVNGYNGLVGTLAADYVKRVGQWTLSAGPRVAIAGSEYMDTYFSVSPQEAAINSRVSAYAADPGVKSVGLAAAATYKWNDAFSTTLRGGYDRLVGSAADSPITKNLGSANQFTVGATASYTFDIGRFGR
jgi:outer membrane scaffolding protein for murein synthesis (MipA/OmpV family)